MATKEEKERRELKEVNEFRAKMRMKLIEKKTKLCLRCNKNFESFGDNHRMCYGCANNVQGEEN